MTERTILHCDLDAFYASVEQRDHPEYRGKPVIVGGGPTERGVVSAASYEARKFGVHSAMPLREAGKRCPHGIFVPGNFEAYEVASDAVMALFAERTPLVEPISLDEAFLDITGTAHLFGGPEACARDLKRAVLQDVGLVLSVGMASNKLCAKVASDLRKPDGFVIVPRGGEAAFLAPLPLARLWGVGPKTRAVLEDLGMRTVGDLATADPALLEARLGEHGSTIALRAKGIDEDRDVVADPGDPKSIGHAHTFEPQHARPRPDRIDAAPPGRGSRPAAAQARAAWAHGGAPAPGRTVRDTDASAHPGRADLRRPCDLRDGSRLAARRARRGSRCRSREPGPSDRRDDERPGRWGAARPLHRRAHVAAERGPRRGPHAVRRRRPRSGERA